MDDITVDSKKIIYKIISYYSGYASKEDLYQAGCLGLIEAKKNYDPSSNAKFTSYAYSYILGEIKKLVREDRPVKVSRDIYYLRGKIEKAREKLSQSLMRYPTDKELSDFLEIPEIIVAEALNSAQPPQYLDDHLGDTNMLMHEVLSNKSVDINDLIYLKNQLDNLPEPEKSIMIKRYYEDMTQKEIAEDLGLTQVDVSRRQNKVLCKIKQT